ncbi:hypothetical protein BDF14DRAFT_1743572 [Spinellus fusiger]|nr:hypothetical protein BDF14DRAFT_1743572 [Spinellus fusiger]
MSFFGKLKSKLKSKGLKKQRAQSPTLSMSSTSSLSSSSPAYPEFLPEEARGIFRTLEVSWCYKMPALPGQSDTQHNEWVQFDEINQQTLEDAFKEKTFCTLTSADIGTRTVSFAPKTTPRPAKKRPLTAIYTLTEKDRLVFLSSPSLPTQTSRQSMVRGEMFLEKDIQRFLAPVWWFEDDSMDGLKNMCRFDTKNQARLEALCDDRSHFVVSDESFLYPCTVRLDVGGSLNAKEELRGFLYPNNNMDYSPEDPMTKGMEYSEPMVHEGSHFTLLDNEINGNRMQTISI